AYRLEDVVPDGIVYIPNTFTPNGDGFNDVFKVYGEGIDHVLMRVYDRWGALVYRSESRDPSWDGTLFNNEDVMDMNTAVFVYVIIIDYMDGSRDERHGDITLVR
ncbi:MAG: gliding motility-associated C-terminal domain-containing protein, partial [Ignavibacteria bacterium]|nr:gliding motility-associated C-terminal domain-containing protein [Ignavibacteria bacterium]